MFLGVPRPLASLRCALELYKDLSEKSCFFFSSNALSGTYGALIVFCITVVSMPQRCGCIPLTFCKATGIESSLGDRGVSRNLKRRKKASRRRSIEGIQVRGSYSCKFIIWCRRLMHSEWRRENVGVGGRMDL